VNLVVLDAICVQKIILSLNIFWSAALTHFPDCYLVTLYFGTATSGGADPTPNESGFDSFGLVVRRARESGFEDSNLLRILRESEKIRIPKPRIPIFVAR
jgi:hypothetical protein